MNFQQLRYFKTVAELEHMTKAADKLFISQPALSKSIHLLEDEIGFPLFDRNGTGIRLNQNGRILYEHAVSILDSMENAMLAINDTNFRHRDVILSVTAATRFLPDIILGVQKDLPDVNLSIRQDPIENTDILCDLYLHSSTVGVNAVNARTLLSEECFLGMSRKNPLSKLDAITPEILKSEVFLTMQNQFPLYQLICTLCQNAGFEPNARLQFDNRETIFALLSANMGVSLIPSKTWAPFIRDYEDIVLLPLTVSCQRHIVLRWRENHYLTGAAKSLIDYLEGFFRTI